jgi:hypothetical protein
MEEPTGPGMKAGKEMDGTKGMKNDREDRLPTDSPDPGLFFRPLSRANPPEEFWTGFWPSIRLGIRETQVLRGGFITRGRALLLGSSAGLMAAAAILVAAFLVVPGTRVPQGQGAPERKAAHPAFPAFSREAPSPPILEDLRSASARVYTFHVGEPADSTDVILIVDESLDI